MPGVMFGKEAVEQIKEIARRVLGDYRSDQAPRGRWQGREGARRDCVIVDGLSAPSDSAGDPSTCVIAFLHRDSDNHLVDSGRRATAYNYDESLSADDGTLAAAEFRQGQWRVYWVSCAASTSFEDLEPEAAP